MVLPEVTSHIIPWSQSTAVPAHPHPLWGHGRGEDQLISALLWTQRVQYHGVPETGCSITACAVPSSGHGLRVDTPHVQKIFSNHSSLFLSKIRFIPFFLLSTNHSFVNFEHLVKNPCLCLVCLREWPLVIAILTENTAQSCALPGLQASRASCTSSFKKPGLSSVQKC